MVSVSVKDTHRTLPRAFYSEVRVGCDAHKINVTNPTSTSALRLAAKRWKLPKP